MSNPDQSPALSLEEFTHWLNDRRMLDVSEAFHEIVSRYSEATEAAAMAATVPAGLERAPRSTLPGWSECKLRVENSDFIAKRVAEGGYGAEHDSVLATELHRFIYEYDDVDAYKSEWFRHRLEKLLRETKADAQAPVAGQPAEPSPADSACPWIVERASTYRGYNVSRFIRGTIRQEWLGANGKVRRASPSNFRSPETAQAAIDKFNRLAAPKGDSNG